MRKRYGLGMLLLGVLVSLLVPGKTIPVYEMIAHIESQETAQQIAMREGIELLSYSRFGMAKYHVEGEENYHQLKALPGLDFEENLGYAPTTVVVDDPLAPQQHALEMLGLYDAWHINTGSPDVTVAVIDTGIDIYHEDLRHNISPLSYNATTDKVGLEHVVDVDGHGTMVAGVITAAKNNGLGVAGAAPGVNLLVIKAELSDDGYFAWFDLAEAIFYAAFNGADVINMSLSGGGDSGNVRRAITTATNRGAIVVASAGNSASGIPEYPAAFANTVGVSSVDADGSISSFSNYGIRVRVAAPGRNIYTTDRGPGSETEPSSRYRKVNGTSFSAPYVSAVLALIKSEFPDMDRETWLNQLYRSSIDMGEPGFDQYYGHGLIHAYHALHPVVKLTLEPNNGDARTHRYMTTSQTVDVDSPVYPGYQFAGWYVDVALTVPFVDLDGPGDLTLYAAWEAKTYTVSYETSGGEIIPPESVTYGEDWQPATPVREGHRFLGWYFDATAKNEPYEDILPPRDVTLTARWLEETYTFALEAGVDTIVVGQSFVDAGVEVSPGFDVEISGSVDTATVGRYTIYYDLYDDDLVVDRLIRVVHVVESVRPLQLTLEAGPSTLPYGSAYHDPGAFSPLGSVDVLGTVDETEPGVYTLTYRVSHDGYYDEIIRKIRVHPPVGDDNQVTAILPKLSMERRWLR
ncbi:MAG: hypothetical protein EA374_07990 [Acholeplasmatales bacterium]|nr:MAG: hypothetical protein EA374_07990 [Acholeplasmatales bacterium]